MSHQKKTNQKKSSSSCSSENHHWQNIEQPVRRGSQSSSKRPIYPNVPKRTRQSLSIDDHEPIDTESRIDIIPSGMHSSNFQGSSSNQNAHKHHTLDLLTKYTSSKKTTEETPHRSSSSLENEINVSSNHPSVYGSKSKRTLDEPDRSIPESKRPKSFDDIEEDDEDELSQLIDHRRDRSKSSQTSNTSISSQTTNDGKQKKTTIRKPTARKLSTTQRKPSASQPIFLQPSLNNLPMETLIIEPDIDLEEETNWSTSDAQISSIQHDHHTERESSLSTPIIPSPIKLPIDHCLDSFNSNIKQPILSSKQTLETSSPCSNHRGVERRFSSTSSTSLFFDTPNSSFSRTTTNNTTSTPQPVMKIDRETQISFPSNIDLLNQLISQMNSTATNHIDYHPRELSGQLFHQCSLFFTNDKYSSMNLLTKKQFLNFGRYEIEIVFPSNENKNSTIYVCDICLKHCSGSAIAFQRHTAKCFHTQPPGQLVFHKDNLAIFQIGEIHLTITQRIYLKSLCRIVRLFMDPNKSIDDTNIDRFTYYILCRRDPILSSSQSSIYRLVGYFSKQINQQTQSFINNLSRLFILPSFTDQEDYYQLLIAFSYSLIRTNVTYSSPARPLDMRTLLAFRIFWREVLSFYMINQNDSSLKTLALDLFARQTSIHPRDILSSLYSSTCLVRHSHDKSSVYLHNHAYRSMTSLNLHNRKKSFFLDMNLMDINDEKKMIIDKANSNKGYDIDNEEIVLD